MLPTGRRTYCFHKAFLPCSSVSCCSRKQTPDHHFCAALTDVFWAVFGKRQENLKTSFSPWGWYASSRSRDWTFSNRGYKDHILLLNRYK